MSPSELEEIYKSNITKQLIFRFRDECPEFPDLSLREFSQSCSTLFDFQWKDDGRLAAEPRLNSDLFSHLTKMYAALVTFGTRRHTRFDSSLYKAIPTWFIDATNSCRFMVGNRLLKRMIRYSMDPKMAPLDWYKREFIYLKNGVNKYCVNKYCLPIIGLVLLAEASAIRKMRHNNITGKPPSFTLTWLCCPSLPPHCHCVALPSLQQKSTTKNICTKLWRGKGVVSKSVKIIA